MTAKPAKSPAPEVSEDLHGRTFGAGDSAALCEAVEFAFNYRGDVTVTRKSDGKSTEGYLFDRTRSGKSGEILIRIIPKDSDDRITIPLSDIAQIAFTGKDTASGKSFQNWIQKYAQKKLAGEAASIESEPLDTE